LKLILETAPELTGDLRDQKHVRQLLKAADIDEFQSRWAVLENSVKATKMVDVQSLFRTLID